LTCFSVEVEPRQMFCFLGKLANVHSNFGVVTRDAGTESA
jgi:hypothetical protein